MRCVAVASTRGSPPSILGGLGHWSQLGELPEVLGGGGEQELVMRSRRSRRMRLRWAKSISTFLRRCLERSKAGERPGHVAGVLVEVARDLASRGVRTAPEFKGTAIAVALAGSIEPGPILGDA